MRSRIEISLVFVVMLIITSGCGSTARTEAVGSPPSATDRMSDVGWSDDVLQGTWEGTAWRINSRGASRILDRLEITCEPNGLLRVKREWQTMEGAGGHKGRTPVMKDEEDLIGVFDARTGRFRFVEMEEPGTMEGHLVDRDTIDLFSTQPGRQPSTSHAQLQRQPAP